jgi:hypothetical protein
MSNDDVLATVDSLLAEARRVSHLTVDPSLKRGVVSNCNETLAGLKAAKKATDDDSALNRLLAAELAVMGASAEMQMWQHLEDGDYEGAWGCLVEAEDALHAAGNAHIDGSAYQVDAQRRLLLETTLFPPQVFMSAGMIVERASCSICSARYDDCDHVKGRAYGGELCTRNIEQAKMLEVSIVEHPSDRRCRVTNVSGVNTMTLAEEQPAK